MRFILAAFAAVILFGGFYFAPRCPSHGANFHLGDIALGGCR